MLEAGCCGNCDGGSILYRKVAFANVVVSLYVGSDAFRVQVGCRYSSRSSSIHRRGHCEYFYYDKGIRKLQKQA